eukprot:363172-Chlamydomonas_euryale.AAC.8
MTRSALAAKMACRGRAISIAAASLGDAALANTPKQGGRPTLAIDPRWPKRPECPNGIARLWSCTQRRRCVDVFMFITSAQSGRAVKFGHPKCFRGWPGEFLLAVAGVSDGCEHPHVKDNSFQHPTPHGEGATHMQEVLADKPHA